MWFSKKKQPICPICKNIPIPKTPHKLKIKCLDGTKDLEICDFCARDFMMMESQKDGNK